MPLKIITTRKGALFGAQRITTAPFLESELECNAGPEPVWYGHCVYLSVNKLAAPRKNFLKLGTLRSLLRPCLGQNATRISPPVVSVGRDLEAIEPT